EKPSEVTAWQFNREFYCIIDHDKEISCAGFIFYGSTEHLFIQLDEVYQNKIDLLFKIFIDEFNEEDTIQGEMLRMLLKRLIILITRLGKQQYNSGPEMETQDLDIVRQFNLAVESHYKKLHQVQDYAALLNKSPKTLSNLFSKHNQKTPLQIIRERITLEAKRLMLYTDSTFKEIAYGLGFDDPTGFSRFFKNQTGYSPSAFRKSNA
ncbi:helix-turn-helix domain-containing protein, partial [bacterium]|nr:helix-turn-helix domain-containing protein [bacterium]